MSWATTRQRAMGATMKTFGGRALLLSVGQEPKLIERAVYDAAYEIVELDAGGGSISSIQPVLFVEDAQLPSDIRNGYLVEPTEGGPADMTGKFRIYDVQPAGAGYSMLVLHRE